MEARIAETPVGPVEYTMAGGGPAVLIVHGGNENCHLNLRQEGLLQAGYRILIPSRPGYGRTPITAGKTASEQADALNALLGTLRIETVALIGSSAGGPTALEFARRYPRATHCLLLEEAITKSWVPRYSPQYWAMKWMMSPRRQAGFWRGQREAFDRDPRASLIALAKIFSTRPPLEVVEQWDEEDIAFYRKLLYGLNSGSGFTHNMDHLATRLEEIAVPVFITHCRFDRNVPFAHALHAHRRIRGSVLYEAPSLSHLILMGPGKSAVVQKRMDFLKQAGW
ncbi:MAG: alpha/beta hydrolase [Anaerolineales bacterium]|nr:alpha/beta hydrolase [Anaerolineales bacterium]